jgi:transposase
MATSQSKFGRRFDEEFKREVAALASRPGARLEEVASDLGVSPWSVSRWRRQYGGGASAQSVPAPASSSGVSVQELERRIRALERENADLREQRTILKKAVAIFSEPPR